MNNNSTVNATPIHLTTVLILRRIFTTSSYRDQWSAVSGCGELADGEDARCRVLRGQNAAQFARVAAIMMVIIDVRASFGCTGADEVMDAGVAG